MTHLRKMRLEELSVVITLRLPSTATSRRSRILRGTFGALRISSLLNTSASTKRFLFRERKLAASTVTQRLAALRFFYTQKIKKAWSLDTPYPKKVRPLPSILSPEEVAHLIDSS